MPHWSSGSNLTRHNRGTVIPIYAKQRRGRIRLTAPSVTIHQDVNLYGSLLAAGKSVTFDIEEGRQVWLQVARGIITANNQSLYTGDGLGIVAAGELTLTATDDAEILLFDLAV